MAKRKQRNFTRELKANSVKRKDEIKAWIKAQGLDDEVFKIEEPIVFKFSICCSSLVPLKSLSSLNMLMPWSAFREVQNFLWD